MDNQYDFVWINHENLTIIFQCAFVRGGGVESVDVFWKTVEKNKNGEQF